MIRTSAGFYCSPGLRKINFPHFLSCWQHFTRQYVREHLQQQHRQKYQCLFQYSWGWLEPLLYFYCCHKTTWFMVMHGSTLLQFNDTPTLIYNALQCPKHHKTQIQMLCALDYTVLKIGQYLFFFLCLRCRECPFKMNGLPNTSCLNTQEGMRTLLWREWTLTGTQWQQKHLSTSVIDPPLEISSHFLL